MGCIFSFCQCHDNDTEVYRKNEIEETQSTSNKENIHNPGTNTSLCNERLAVQSSSTICENSSYPLHINYVKENETKVCDVHITKNINKENICHFDGKSLPKNVGLVAKNISILETTQNKYLSTLQVVLIENFLKHDWNFEAQLKNANIVNIPFKSVEGRSVIKYFNKTAGNILTITGISRIENVFLYAMYLIKKEEMESRNGHVDELNLFHGTKKEHVRSICNNNFDWRRHGERDFSGVSRFGKGVCFAQKAMYARHYCDRDVRKVMILAKVLVSNAIVGNKDMIIPNDIHFGRKYFYDTSVKYDTQVIVKYGDNEFYPAYRITFTDSSHWNSRPRRN